MKETGDHFTIKRVWLVEFLDGKGAVSNGNESDNSDNDDGNFKKNNE